MKAFIRKYENRIHGVLSCFDRMLFRGYLPIMSGWAMAGFLYRLNVNFGNLKAFLLENSERVNKHAIAVAKKHGRPFRYLASNIDKDGTARQLAERDRIEHGLVCIFSILEPCRSFSFLFKKPLPDQRPFVKPARRKCLHLYFYFMDRNLGLIHVRIQTWFPIILFKNRQGLSELYPELLSHGTLCFGAKEVMHFLGRKLRGNFEGDIVSDLSDFSSRMPGCRIRAGFLCFLLF